MLIKVAQQNGTGLRCPVDRRRVNPGLVFKDIALERLIGGLLVKCPQANEGCRWTGDLSDTTIHQEKCEWRRVECEMSVKDLKVELYIPTKHSRAMVSKANIVDFVQHSSTAYVKDTVVAEGASAWYEVQLLETWHSRRSGSCFLKVGWVDNDIRLHEQLLIGDSNGLDPFRGYERCISINGKYSRKNSKYHINDEWGLPISSGDVIGVAIDASKGQILFSHNGRWDFPMGVAYSGVSSKNGWFPAITYCDGRIQLNFGEREFAFAAPDDSYRKVIDFM